MTVIRVPWSGAAFLAYLGGITIFFAVAALLSVEAGEYGASGFVVWSVLVYAVAAVCAIATKWSGHRITAGLLALTAVSAFIVFVGALWDWFGWLDDTESAFDGFRLGFLALELVAVLASIVAWRIFRFPLLVLFIAVAAWVFVTDLISNGGNWSAIVTIAAGLVLLLAAVATDGGESRVTGFWLHVVAGLTIGGGLLWFFHAGAVDWILVAIAALAYMALGHRLARSSWIVLGAWGLLQTAVYFAERWSDLGEAFFPLFYLFPFVFSFDFGGEPGHPWIASLVFVAAGMVFIAVAWLLARRGRAAIPAADLI